MKGRQHEIETSSLYDDVTEPLPVLTGVSVTTPLPISTQPREFWLRRFIRGIGNFFAAIIAKVNQLLALGLAVLLLLLFTRFILLFFSLKLSDFAYWVFYLTTPLIAPFEHLVPALPYEGYSIDVSTLIAVLVYALGVTIVRQFLKILAPTRGQ